MEKKYLLLTVIFLILPIAYAVSVTQNDVQIIFVDCESFKEVNSVSALGSGEVCWKTWNRDLSFKRNLNQVVKIYNPNLKFKNAFLYENISHPKRYYSYFTYDCSFYDNSSNLVNKTCQGSKINYVYDYFYDWENTNHVEEYVTSYSKAKTNSMNFGKNESKYFKLTFDKKAKLGLELIKLDILTEGDVIASLDPFLNTSYYHKRQGWVNLTYDVRDNIPIYINVTANTYITDNKMRSDVWDLKFTNASENVNLKYEFENKTNPNVGNSTDNLGVWLLLEGLNPIAETSFYMYYNSSTESKEQFDRSMWADANFKAVYHAEGIDGLDSAGADANVTWNQASNFNSTSIFGKGFNLLSSIGVDQGLNTSAYLLDGEGTTWTVELWLMPYVELTNRQIWAEVGNCGSANCTFLRQRDAAGNNKFEFQYVLNGASSETIASSGRVINSTWHYIAVTSNSTSSAMFVGYRNGSYSTSAGGGAVNFRAGTFDTIPFNIGHNGIGNTVADGLYDEVRISGVYKNWDYFKAQLAVSNQSNHHYGTEISQAPAVISTIQPFPANASVVGRSQTFNLTLTNNGSAISTVNLVLEDFYNRSVNSSSANFFWTHLNFTQTEEGNRTLWFRVNTTELANSSTENNKTMLQIDVTPPNLNISSTTTDGPIINATFSINDTHLSSCWFNITSATGVIIQPHTQLTNCENNISIEINLGATYSGARFNIFANDTGKNSNSTSAVFSVQISTPSPSAGAGGAGGGFPGILGENCEDLVEFIPDEIRLSPQRQAREVFVTNNLKFTFRPIMQIQQKLGGFPDGTPFIKIAKELPAIAPEGRESFIIQLKPEIIKDFSLLEEPRLANLQISAVNCMLITKTIIIDPNPTIGEIALPSSWEEFLNKPAFDISLWNYLETPIIITWGHLILIIILSVVTALIVRKVRG